MRAPRLLDGRFLVAGGESCCGFALDGAEIHDPASGTWTRTGSLISPYYNPATLLGDGGSWSPAAPPGSPRSTRRAELPTF